jgi:hypothetical protein
MIVDYKLFEPKEPLKSGTLWILEQIPGYTEAADVTNYLLFGYWPSYNIPFFSEISERSGCKKFSFLLLFSLKKVSSIY